MWPVVKLRDAVEFVSTGPFGSLLHSEDYVEGGIPLVNPSNIVDGNIVPDSTKTLDITTLARLQSYVLAEGDVVVARRGELGRCAAVRADQQGWLCGTGSFFVRPSSRLLPEFLVLLLTSAEYRSILEKASTGATMPNISNVTLQNLLIPLPPLAEQKHIVAILDEAFEGIRIATANTERNFSNARELFEAHVRSCFAVKGRGWVECHLPDISQNLDSQRVPITKRDRVHGSIPYYGASGVVDHVEHWLFNEDLLLISEDGANLLARSTPIAFAISGKSWVNNHAHVLKFEDAVVQDLVELYLNSISLEPFVSGMAQPKLNQGALNSIPIFLPPEPLREGLLERAHAFRESTSMLRQSYVDRIAQILNLKQSLLSRAFAGKLTATLERAA